MMLKYECKYCWSFLIVVGRCYWMCMLLLWWTLLVVAYHSHQQPAGLVIKCKIKPPCHSHGCRNTWQYDTYYQHRIWCISPEDILNKTMVRLETKHEGCWSRVLPSLPQPSLPYNITVIEIFWQSLLACRGRRKIVIWTWFMCLEITSRMADWICQGLI